MATFRTLFLFFLLTAIAFAASDVLHDSCNRTRFSRLCIKFLHQWPRSDRHGLTLYSFDKIIATGISTIHYANVYINGTLTAKTYDNRLLDCVNECAFAINRSVTLVEQAKAELGVDLKKATTLVRWAISDVLGAGCAKRGGPILGWIHKNDKKYKQLLRIAQDLINLLKK